MLYLIHLNVFCVYFPASGNSNEPYVSCFLKLLVALDMLTACFPYQDISISRTQHHLWKLSPNDLVTVETCYQSLDKFVWIIWQSLRAVRNVFMDAWNLWGLPQIPVKRLGTCEQHCPPEQPCPAQKSPLYMKDHFRFRERWDEHRP